MRKKLINPWAFAIVIIFVILSTTLGILGLLSPLWTHQHINEAKPVPGDEFPMDLDNKRH